MDWNFQDKAKVGQIIAIVKTLSISSTEAGVPDVLQNSSS